MHQNVPQLLQMLERLLVGSPVPPIIWPKAQRRLSGSDDRGVNHTVASDPLREPRDGRSAKIGGHVSRRHAKPNMPLEWNRVLSTECLETVTG